MKITVAVCFALGGTVINFSELAIASARFCWYLGLEAS